MNEQEILSVVQASIENSKGLNPTQLLFMVVVGGVSAFFGAYISEKGKRTAYKEDIEDITSRIETIKLSIDSLKNTESAKYEMKHESCLEAVSYTHLTLPTILRV